VIVTMAASETNYSDPKKRVRHGLWREVANGMKASLSEFCWFLQPCAPASWALGKAPRTEGTGAREVVGCKTVGSSRSAIVIYW
jgi:hypothetical protein